MLTLRCAPWFFVLSSLPLLAGCATLSESDCRTARWAQIGERDGANGRAEDHVLEHDKACARYGVQPDHLAWLEGRERGLERYCTVRNGYRIGEVGGSYNDVCFAGAELEFRRGYDLGLRMNRARSALERVENEIRTLEARVAKLQAGTDQAEVPAAQVAEQLKYLQRRLRELEFERGYLRRDVDALQWQGRAL
jgi:hypothetical protein